MYAVFTTGGKQYRVAEGDVIFVEKLEVAADEVIEFDNVLVVGKDDGAVVGTPNVEGAKVVAKALKNGKVDCVIIDNEPAKSYVAANSGLKILETEYAVEDYAICFQKNSTLKAAVDGALKDLIADGSVKKIVDKYINNTGDAKVGVPVAKVDTDKPDLVMATDPDSDRIGIAVPDEEGNFVLLNGNQTCVLLTYYMCRRWKENGMLDGKQYIVKTIVEQHRETISVTSENGLTAFTFTLPLVN